MVDGSMESSNTATCLKGFWCRSFLLFTVFLSTFKVVEAVQVLTRQVHLYSKPDPPGSPATGLFEPIEISPAVIPHYQAPKSPVSPLYPSKPGAYDPVLTGRCPLNFSATSSIVDRTASDCSLPFASVVGNVICCPQISSLLHVFLGYYSRTSGKLVLQNATASDCFADSMSILVSRGANGSIPSLCSVKALNLTGGSCPVNDVAAFEKTVNTSQLLESCSSIDPLKECCSPVCQPAITNAILQLTAGELNIGGSESMAGGAVEVDVINDCKGVVYSWLARNLSLDAANTAFRILSSCKVNKVCPLDFGHPSEVVKACRNVAAPSPSCCSSLSSYVAGLQKQMLITNRQAIICATIFASMLQDAGVMTNLYELCGIDLKDFSLQGTEYGQGCLLHSLPTDVVFDNSTGYSFMCDLNDDTEAPWPSSSSMSSLSLCAEKSLPARPNFKNAGNMGCSHGRFQFISPIFSLCIWYIFVLRDNY